MAKELTVNTKPLKICLVTAVPGTLIWFYAGLLKQLKNESADVTVVSSDMPKLQYIKEQLNCRVFPVEMARKISFAKDLVAIYKLTRHLSRQEYDIIHAHMPKGALIGLISAFIARTPIRVYTMHGLLLETFTGFKRKIYRFIEWLMCSLATDVLSVSPSVIRRSLEEKVCSASKIKMLGNGTACGIDLDKFNRTDDIVRAGWEIRKQLNIPKDAIVVGYVGRILPDKGIECLIRAYGIVHKQLDNTFLLLVGTFETMRQTLDFRTMETIRENKHIHCTGHAEDPVPFYSAMDMVLLPSRREGFGLTLIEAAALQLPTIASRVTGCIDAVVDNDTGLLVQMDNDEEFAQAILKLARDKELRDRLGSQGNDRVRKLFGSKRLIEEHIKFYQQLILENSDTRIMEKCT